MIDLGRGCSRHRSVLIDFVDRGDIRPGTAAALDHLDRCDRCTESIESTMLTITALRRLGDEAADAEPTADAWPRLRVRIEGRPRRAATMSPLAGIAMSFAIVAAIVLPVRTGGALIGPVATPQATRDSSTGADERRIEAAYIAAVRQGIVAQSGGLEAATGTVNPYPRIYPDNIRPTRKEVGAAEPTGRPPEAI